VAGLQAVEHPGDLSHAGQGIDGGLRLACWLHQWQGRLTALWASRCLLLMGRRCAVQPRRPSHWNLFALHLYSVEYNHSETDSHDDGMMILRCKLGIRRRFAHSYVIGLFYCCYLTIPLHILFA
jgi:hypothetical protein